MRNDVKKEQLTNTILISNKKIEALKKNFPNCFDKNGNFDFEKFKKELSNNEVDFSKENYEINWLGKSYAKLLATNETTTLLKENEDWNKKEENKNSQNLLIKGDNLEVLKHLSNVYYEKIKMIYIDPPYNTGSDGFVYQDNRKFTVEKLSKLAGIDEEKAKRILDFVNSKSNSHSAWLTFMYPRLYIARQLLKDDGVIFVSIDDNEVAQLRILMDEIFGEKNFVVQIVVKSNPGGRDYGGIAQTHDYILVYSKADFKLYLIEDKNKQFRYKDENGPFDIRELRNRNIKFNKDNRPNLYYPFYVNENNKDENNLFEVSLEKKEGYKEVYPLISQGVQTVWRWGKEKVLANLNTNVKAKRKQDGGFMIIEKYRSNFYREKSIFEDKKYRNEQGSLREKEVFDGKKPFDYPKSDFLIKKLILLGSNSNDLILDFFAGSGTTGDAVMQLNAEDGGNRKYILVQLPEPITIKKNKTIYDFIKNELGVENPTIFDITKERLIRAGKKIKEDYKDKDLSNIDFGFKIFKTIPIRENYKLEAEEFNSQIELFDKTKLTEDEPKTLFVTWKTFLKNL